MDKEETMYFTAENIIVTLMKADKKRCLELNRVYYFIDFIRRKLIAEEGQSSSNCRIIFDISFYSIQNMVMYNDDIFALVGEKIYLKTQLPEIKGFSYLTETVEEFIENPEKYPFNRK